MDTKLFGPKRRQVNLGGSTHQAQGSLKEARLARERREQARIQTKAAVTLQAAFRAHHARKTLRDIHTQEYDHTPLNQNTLVHATRLLLASQPDPGRYAAWCRFVVSSKSIFEPLEQDATQWTYLLERMSMQLLALAGQVPQAPQTTLFLEVVRMLVDSKKYPTGYSATADHVAAFLVSHGLYQRLRQHFLAIDPDQTSLPSLPSAVNLSLAPLVHTEELPSEFLSFVSIPLLNSRIPPNALKNLTTSFPVIKFLRYFSRARKLDAATAASLLANCTPFIAPRLRDLKWDDAKGYLFFLGTCFKALPISYFSKPANSTAMDIDEPSSTVDSSQMLDRLLSTAHLSAVLAMSRSSSASRPALAEFTCSLLPLLSARQTEDFLTVLAFSPSAGSGLVRELFRIVRTDPVFKLGASKEQWKDVVRCLTDRQNVEGWSILLLLVLVYTRMLRSMGDDAFYPSNNFANSSSTSSSSNASTEQNPLQLEEVRSLAELVRNIAFALYWQPPDRARIGRMNVEGVRDTFRKLASALHERDSRRTFLPPGLFTMTGAGAFDVQSFIETALQEDQRIEEEEEEGGQRHSQSQLSAGADRTATDSDTHEEEESRQQRRRIPQRSRNQLSRRQLNIISPRLGLLNSLPFIIPFETRVSVFRHFIAADYARLPASVGMREYMGGRDVFNVRRGHVAEDGFKLNSLGASGLKRRLAIQFYDQFGELEAGIDGGGLFKEFLTDLCKEAFDVNRGLWRTNSRLELYPAPSAYAKDATSLQWYHFLGKIIGKAMYEGILVSVPFAGFFFSKWLGKQSFLDDLASLDPELYNGMVQLKNYKGDVSDLSLSFAVDEDDLGVSRTVDLMPGGRDVPVTNENRNAYIARVCHYHLNIRIREQCTAFVSGLQEIISPRWLRLFSVSELRTLVEGTDQPVDVDDLRANTVYAGVDESSETITYFWSVLAELGASERKAFLRFVTSADKAPLLGFKELNPRFAIRDAGEDVTRLPSASTCVNLLKLPRYQSKALLKQKLLMAITARAGFDLS